MIKKILCSHRRRSINGTFAFIEHRFLRDGYFTMLNHHELVLYLFLVLVADRDGISWYAYDNICSTLKITLEEYITARNGLIDKDFIATDGYFFQVLSLPLKKLETPNLLKTQQDMDRRDPATIDYYIRNQFGAKND
jgi:hypothetical protein